jgi:hypothetical protein
MMGSRQQLWFIIAAAAVVLGRGSFGRRQGLKSPLLDHVSNPTHLNERIIATIMHSYARADPEAKTKAIEIARKLMDTQDELSAVPSFEFCGNRWLQHTFGISLAVVKVPHPVARVGDTMTFIVHGVKHDYEGNQPSHDTKNKRAACTSADFDLWARAVGPAVVMAEVSLNVTATEANSCEWKVVFKVPVAGEYKVEVLPVWWVKGGTWGAEKVWSREQCTLK